MNTISLFFSFITATLYRSSKGGFLDLIFHAGLVVKLVLLILLFFSIISWAIIFFKFKTIRRAERDTKEFQKIFRSNKDFAAIYTESRRFRLSPIVQVFRAGYTELSQRTKTINNRSGNHDRKELMQSEGGNSVERALKRANTAQIIRLERNLSFLATTGNSAPFIGLFGTVWGIMEAFQEIGQKGATSLAIVAPGISEALIATAAGLFAAIPAVIAYNYYLSRIRRLVSEMDNFTTEFLSSIER